MLTSTPGTISGFANVWTHGMILLITLSKRPWMAPPFAHATFTGAARFVTAALGDTNSPPTLRYFQDLSSFP